jgi:hypothetical protein
MKLVFSLSNSLIHWLQLHRTFNPSDTQSACAQTTLPVLLLSSLVFSCYIAPLVQPLSDSLQHTTL